MLSFQPATHLKAASADGFKQEFGSRRFVSSYLARDQIWGKLICKAPAFPPPNPS